MPSLFKDWHAYFERYCKVGGVIEAVPMCPPGHIGKPSVSFFIEPHGNIEFKGSYDKFEATKYVNAGMFYPQTNIAPEKVFDTAMRVGKLLYSKGVMGHVTIDFVSFVDAQNKR